MHGAGEQFILLEESAVSPFLLCFVCCCLFVILFVFVGIVLILLFYEAFRSVE